MSSSVNAHTAELHSAGVSLWLDNITRGMLNDGTLQRYIDEYSITGLTSNPSIFDKAIADSDFYDDAIRKKHGAGLSGEDLFFELALEDLTRAADLFKPIHERTDGLDGFVSLEVSPLLAYDTAATIEAAKTLFAKAGRRNLFIKIPGTPEGLPAIEEAIFAGVPVNVTLLFSAEHYLACAEAYLRGIERRIEAGLNPDVRSVASLFISRWDGAAADQAPDGLRNQLGLAVGMRTYRAYRELLGSARMLRAMNHGAQPQRLLWASTGTKDPNASDVLYISGLVAPYTVNTMPEKTLKMFADHGQPGEPLPIDGGDADAIIEAYGKAGVDYDQLALKLQQDGAKSFVKAWNELLESLESKAAADG